MVETPTTDDLDPTEPPVEPPVELPVEPPASSQTIGDLIVADERAQAELAEANRLQVEASAAVKQKAEAAEVSDDALSAGLDETGAVFKVREDGTAAIYSSDGAKSYHVSYAKPESTPVSASSPITPPPGA